MIDVKDSLSLALQSLCPGASWTIKGTEIYENIIWSDTNIPKPSKQEVLEKINENNKNYELNLYKKQRAAEYPPVTDYLDAVVKGDLEQQQAYIDACLAVKAKYPKPKGV